MQRRCHSWMFLVENGLPVVLGEECADDSRRSAAGAWDRKWTSIGRREATSGATVYINSETVMRSDGLTVPGKARSKRAWGARGAGGAWRFAGTGLAQGALPGTGGAGNDVRASVAAMDAAGGAATGGAVAVGAGAPTGTGARGRPLNGWRGNDVLARMAARDAAGAGQLAARWLVARQLAARGLVAR